MIRPESIYILKENFIHFTRMPVLEDIEEECMDELRECCGKLLATDRESEHTLCDRVEEVDWVGGLSIELEKCPHPGCGARFYASPGQNLKTPGLLPPWGPGLHLCSM